MHAFQIALLTKNQKNINITRSSSSYTAAGGSHGSGEEGSKRKTNRERNGISVLCQVLLALEIHTERERDREGRTGRQIILIPKMCN